MEEYTQITVDQWMEWKEDIRKKLAETAGNFVHIGYRLKQIRDSGMYDGAADIFGFAEKEYGLGKSTVSRFIAINEKYSEGGNSLELKEEFRGYSSSKLAEMLTLPDSEIELLTEKTTVREIRELKSFLAQEEKEYPQEEIPGQATFEDYPGLIPGTEERGERAEPKEAEEGQEDKAEGGEGPEGERLEETKEWPPLEKCIIDFFREKRETLEHVMWYLGEDPLKHPDSEPDYKSAAEEIAPSGQASHKKGLVFLFFYSWEMGVKYRVMGNPLPVSMTWPGMLEVIRDIYRDYKKPGFWEVLYEEPAKRTQAQGQEKEQAAAGDAGTAEEGRETLKKQSAEASLKEPEIIPGTGAVEISGEREETDGEETGEVPAAGGQGNDPAAGMQEGAGAAGADDDSAAGSDACDGAAEGGGCEEDSGADGLSEEQLDDIWGKIEDCMNDMEEIERKFRFAEPGQIGKEDLKEAYDKAVGLAAGLEKLLIAMGGEL